MTNDTKESNGARLTVDQLESGATKIENDLEAVNKHTIIKMLKVLTSITNIMKRKEDGIFNALVKWFRLYLKLCNIIDPDDKKLQRFYENTVPTIITYLIGCLQYKPKEVPNYHHNLLEILEELIENVQPNVLRKITKFEKETIGCLWTPIELAGDYNTQLKALNIFSVLLKYFDEHRQNEEINAIKWTNLNFFQEKLKAIVQATKLSHVLENLSRELLNNYNMNLSKTLLVYSFYCTSVTFAKKHKFYKPLNLKKFWIDINYCPKTLSFCGRYKLKSSSKYKNISITLKIRKIILKNNTLQVYFNKPGDFSQDLVYFTSVLSNMFEFILPEEEKQRLVNNNYVIEYFNNLDNSNSINPNQTDRKMCDLIKSDMNIPLKENKSKKSNNSGGTKIFKNIETSQTKLTPKENVTNASKLFDILKQTSVERSLENSSCITSNLKRKNTDTSSKACLKIESEVEKRPKRSLRTTNKFFKSFLMEDSFDEFEGKIPKRKRKQKRRSRQTKSNYKQVCKVIPTVDLTKIENKESTTNKATDTNNADVYEVAETTYARPCQSYRNFQIQSTPIQKPAIAKDVIPTQGCKRNMNVENQSSIAKKGKLNYDSQENKENENPQTNNSAAILRSSSNTKAIISPHLFETQASIEVSPLNQLAKAKISESSISSSSSECEEVRGPDENILKDVNHICTPNRIMTASNTTTPRPTSAMNVSNMSDSDVEIIHINTFRNRENQQNNLSQDDMVLDMELIELGNDPNTVSKLQFAYNKESTKDNSEVLQQQILEEFEDDSDNEFDLNCLAPIKNAISELMSKNLSDINHDYKRECIIFKTREEENSSSDDEINSNERANNKTESALQKPLVSKQNIFQKKDLCISADNNFQISSNLATSTATKCQITPAAIIMHKIQISAEKSIILKREGPQKISKANKCLNDFFVNKNTESLQLQTENYATESQHLNTFKEVNYARPCSKSLPSATNLIKIHPTESQQNSAILNAANSNFSEIASRQEEATIGNFSKAFRNDLLQILNNYHNNINKRVDNILREGIKNISDRYAQHFLDVTKTINKKSEEDRSKLKEIRLVIGNLVRELECQCDEFINKSKEFDIRSEMCKHILANSTTMEVPNFIKKEYEDIFKKIHTEQNVGFQNVHNFLAKQN